MKDLLLCIVEGVFTRRSVWFLDTLLETAAPVDLESSCKLLPMMLSNFLDKITKMLLSRHI
jgi:hypothetical protein